MFKFFKKSKERLSILKDKQNPNSYENRIADFDKKCGILLEKGLINPDFYFSSRKYYALKVYGEDIILVE
jgi:hypothetical protein